MNTSLALVVLVLVATGSASKSLLETLFDYNDPLLLDEHKAKRVAESWAKGKANKGSSKTKSNTMLSQFDYDMSDDYEYKDTINKDYDSKSNEAEQVDQQSQHTGDEIQNGNQGSKEQYPGSNEQGQTSNKNDCPSDMPTYRMYSVLSGCGVPIDQEVVKPGSTSDKKPEPVKPEVEEEHLANYFHQVGQQGVGQQVVEKIDQQHQEDLGSQTGKQDYNNQEHTDTQGELYGQTSEDQHTHNLAEIVEEPFVQTSGSDRILGQEGQNLGQHETGQVAVKPGQQDHSSEQIFDYDQIEQAEPLSGQYEQNLGPSGRYEQMGQVGQQGQVSGGLGTDSDEFKETEQFWEDYGDSKEFNQVSGSNYNQIGKQEQIDVPGQQNVGLPELPERVQQQSGNNDAYHLRYQSGGRGIPLQEQGASYNSYYVPGNAPKPPSISVGSASVGTSYNGGGPLVNIPNPNQTGIGQKFSCLGKSEGYYVDYASDCRRFYRCVSGDTRVFEFQCGSGTKFDINTSQCGHAHEVVCDPKYNK